MRRRQLEIQVVSNRSTAGEQSTISVKGADGTTRTYSTLDELPSDLQPLVAPLFERAARLLGESRDTIPARDAETEGDDSRWQIEPTLTRRKVRTRRPRRSLEIDHAWFDPVAALGGFALAAAPVLMVRGTLLGRDPWSIWTILALLLSAVGLYGMLLFLINHTTLKADAGGLTVRHWPLPWPGNRSYPREELLQFFVRVRSRSRFTEYQLCVQTSRGTFELIGNLQQPEQLRRYEQDLETFLGIEDRPVRGSQYR